MERGIKDRTIQEVLKTLDRLVEDPQELEHWTTVVETTAKSIDDDNDHKIQFEYYPDEKLIKFHVKDAKSRDSLLKSIEMHLPLIPESVQGFFSVLKYNLKNTKF